MRIDSGTLKQQHNMSSKPKHRRKGRVTGTTPHPRTNRRTQRPAFIVTESSQATETEREASAALFQRCVDRQGLIRLRLDPRVYDPERKAYVLLPGESITMTIFSRETAEGLLVGVRESLLNAE